MALSLLFIPLYAVNFRTTLTGDSAAHLYQAASLLWSGDFTLDEYAGQLRTHADGGLPYFVIRSEGHIRSIFNFLPALVLLPVFTAASLFCGPEFQSTMTQWGLAGKFAASMLIFGAGWMIWLAIRRRVPATAAAMILAVYWFGTPLWATSMDYSQSQPLQFFKAAAFAALFSINGTSRLRWYAAGLLLGASVLARYQSLPSAVAVTAVTVVFNLRDRRVLLFLAGLATLVPIGAAYQKMTFGSPFARGPDIYLAFNAPMLPTMLKLFINPSKGILVHSPWTLLALAGPVFLLRGPRVCSPERRIILTCAASAVPTVILYSNLNGWAGGWCWGYRYLSDILPELALIAAFAFRAALAIPWLRVATLALVAISIAFQAVGALSFDNQWHVVFDSGFHREAWLWQIRDSEIPFYVRRGEVLIGSRRIVLYANPYAARGFHAPEDWNGRKMVWTTDRARFFRVALEHPAAINLFPSPAATEAQPQKVRISGPHIAPRVLILKPGQMETVELPEIPFLLGRIVEITVDRTHEESSGGRRLGVAIPLDEINYPQFE